MDRKRTPTGSWIVPQRINGETTAGGQQPAPIDIQASRRQSIADLWAEVPMWAKYLAAMFLGGSGGSASVIAMLPFETKVDSKAKHDALLLKIEQLPGVVIEKLDQREAAKKRRGR